jgi:hypothetical protein
MDIRELELSLKQKGYDVKVLYWEYLDGEYWIVYTSDIEYIPTTPLKLRDYLEEEEKDIIAVDIEDAIAQISEKENA